jgi:hypothetical protein
MKRRDVLAAGAILALASIVIVALRNNEAARETRQPAPSTSSSAAPARQAAAVTSEEKRESASATTSTRESLLGRPALVAPQTSELSTTESPSLADRLGAPATKPEQEAQIVLDLLKIYRRSFGAYPAGEDNRQLMNAMRGANPDKLPFLPQDHPRLNANGELVDAWGTPFFFHQNSSTSVEVRSAGADHLMYTDDDIVAGTPHPRPDRSAVAEDTPQS